MAETCTTTYPEVECPRCGFTWLDPGLNPIIGAAETCPGCKGELTCLDVETTWMWAERNGSETQP